MAMFKTIGSGACSCAQIDNYLSFGERHADDYGERLDRYLAGDRSASRALAFASTSDLEAYGAYGWHREMDRTRERWGKDVPPQSFRKRQDRARAEGKSVPVWRNYYHFVISPDPEDHASVEEVLDLARRWCDQCWPESKGYQWFVSVHDDNVGRVVHAHIVLNAVRASDGKKVAISRKESDRLAATCQRIAADYGMGQMPSLAEYRRRVAAGEGGWEPTAPQRIGAAEKALRARGAESWVAYIREAVDRAVRGATSWGDFERRLFEVDGVRVEWSRRGLGFRHPDSGGHDKKVMGTRLGSDYTEEGIQGRLSPDYEAILTGSAGGDGPITAREAREAALRRRPRPSPPARMTLAERVRWAACKPRGIARADIKAAVAALRVINLEGFETRRDLGLALEKAREEAAGARARLAAYESAYEAAAGVLDRVKESRDLSAELESMPDGAWTKSIRERRAAIEKRLAENDAFARRRLESAAAWLEGRVAEDASTEDRVAEVILALRDLVREEGERSAALASRLSALESTEKAVATVCGETAARGRGTGALRGGSGAVMEFTGRPTTVVDLVDRHRAAKAESEADEARQARARRIRRAELERMEREDEAATRKGEARARTSGQDRVAAGPEDRGGQVQR